MRQKQIRAGNLGGWMYDFDAGEGLPEHVHSKDDAHITIVTRGKIRVTQPGDDPEVLKPGESVYFAPGDPHEITAIVDGTRIYNILTGG